MSAKRDILVFGAGVIGLTSAIRLRENGHRVLVLAQEIPSTILDRESSPLKSFAPGTYTSSGSGGLWMPFLLEGEGVERWSKTAYVELSKQVNDNVGVDILTAFLLRAKSTSTDLPWYSSLTQMTVETPETDPRIPVEYRSALRFSAPIVHMERYMRHLEKTAMSLGIDIDLTANHTAGGKSTKWTCAEVAKFAKERFGQLRPVVVNCCGIGAGSLSGEEMVPGRGITVRVARPAGIRYVMSEDASDGILSHNGLMAYAIPRGDEYTLGGTAFMGDWSEKATDEEVRGVLERAGKLIPALVQQAQTGIWAGLRPIRKNGMARVELQKEGLGGDMEFSVVANYGHGGSGVTTCWGCADEVVEIVAGLGSA